MSESIGVSQPQPASLTVSVAPSIDELRSLKTACSSNPRLQDIWDVIGIVANTGIRMGELLALRWADVDLSRRSLTISDRKTGCSRLVPIGRETAAIMRMRFNREGGAPYVTKQLMNRILKQASDLSMRVCNRRLRISDFRSSFGQRWFLAGGSSDALALITGRAIVINKRLLSGTQRLYFTAARLVEAIEV